MSDDGDHAHPDEGRLTRGRELAATTGQPGQIAVFTPEQVEAARGYADASRAASTLAKYVQHWTAFVAWCREHGHRPLPADPAAVAVHLSGLAADGIAPQTLALRMAAIGYAHQQAGEAIPHKVRGGTVILDVLAGARREWRGSEIALFGLHKACGNDRPLRVGYRWEGILCGRRRASLGQARWG